MRGSKRCEAPKRLHALPFGCHRLASSALIRRDDDVDETLEEISLLLGAGPPRLLERLVRLEVGPCARQGKALVGRPL